MKILRAQPISSTPMGGNCQCNPRSGTGRYDAVLTASWGGGFPNWLSRATGNEVNRFPRFSIHFQFHFHPALGSCTYIPPPDAYIKERKQPYTFQGRIAGSFPSFYFFMYIHYNVRLFYAPFACTKKVYCQPARRSFLTRKLFTKLFTKV